MKNALSAALLTVLLTGCIREVQPPPSDKYTVFPKSEILQASFYYQKDGKDISGDDAGTIEANEDGTYKVRMRRRSPSTSPSAMFIGRDGSFTFSEFYKIICTFPDDPRITDKPFRVYACASVGADAMTDADYPTANDLQGAAVFRNNVAIGTFEMTNEGINYLNPDPTGQKRPYTTVFLYLYFNNVSDPDDWYEFTLDFVGGANASMSESVVTKAEAYRDTDNSAKCEIVKEEYEVTDPVYYTKETKNFILGNYYHALNSRKLSEPIPVVTADSLRVDLHVPEEDAGKQIEFVLKGGAGLYAQGNTANLINADMVKAARVLAGGGTGEQTKIVTETRIPGSAPGPMSSYEYTIKAKTVKYSDMTGVKLVIGTGPFANTERFTCTIKLPDKYVGE
jgi:hypothetical protein